MDFELTRQQKLGRKIAREFAERELAPYAQQWDEEMAFPAEAIKKLGPLGFMGISIPKSMRARALTASATASSSKSLRAAAPPPLLSSPCTIPLAPTLFMLLAMTQQKQKYLPDLCSGRKLGAFALTEPNAGSDPASLETMAEPQGGHFLLNGVKTFITSGSTCDTVIVMAATRREKKSRGITAFIVEKGTARLQRGRKRKQARHTGIRYLRAYF